MKENSPLVRTAIAMAVLALGLACGPEDSPVAPNIPPVVVPDSAAHDFSILDLNSTSPSYRHAVSPRHYVGRVSAWYFGQAT